MALSFFERVSLADYARQLTLGSYVPEIELAGLVAGVDNLRQDVYLSPKFVELARGHISYLIEKHGGVEELVKDDPLQRSSSAPYLGPNIRKRGLTPASPSELKPTERAAEFKKALIDIQITSLNYAKADGN